MLQGLRSRVAGWLSPTASAAPVVKQAGETHEALVGVLRGTTVSRRGTAQLIQAYNDMPWLRSVVHKIAESVAATRWQLFVKRRAGRAQRARRLERAAWQERQTLIKQQLASNDLVEIEEHPLLDLLEEGNPLLSGHSVVQLWQTYMDLKGEAFTGLTIDGTGKPSALWPFPPNWIMDVPSPDRPFFLFSGRGTRKDIPAELMLWWKDPDPSNPYGRGSGTAEALADELDTDENAAVYIKSFFINHGLPDAFVGLPNVRDDELRAIEQKFRDDHRGAQKGHRVNFINRKIDVQKIGQTFEDLPIVELRKFARDTVQQVFGIPPEVLGILESSNRATIEAAAFMFARWVLVPRLERIRIALQNQLVPMFDERLILEFESPVPDDKTFQLDAAKAAPHALTRGEWRTRAGEDPHEEGDDVFLQSLTLTEVQAGTNGTPVVAVEPVQPTQETPLLPAAASAPLLLVKAFGLNDIDNVLEALRPERLTVPARELWSDELKDWVDLTLVDLGVGVSFDILNPLVVEHLREFSTERITGLVNETTRGRLKDQLIEGVRAGESIDDLAKRIESVFGAAKGARSRVIARTEVLGSSGFGTQHGFEISGVVDFRQWITTPDASDFDGNRPHFQGELEGQVQRLNQPFQVDGFTAMHPGDFGVPFHDISCRCTLVAVIDVTGTGAEESKTAWRQFDQRLRPWERRAERTFRAGFAEQEREVLEALRSTRA